MSFLDFFCYKAVIDLQCQSSVTSGNPSSVREFKHYRRLHLSVDTRQKKHVLIGCQTWRVQPPNTWSLTAVKAKCRAKGKLFSAFRSYFIFLNFQAYFSLRNKHTWLQKLFLTSKNSCKEDFVERKQIKSTTATYSKLRMFSGKTCHVCTQLEHVFSSCVHA